MAVWKISKHGVFLCSYSEIYTIYEIIQKHHPLLPYLDICRAVHSQYLHYLKNIRVENFSGPYFLLFSLNNKKNTGQKTFEFGRF